MLPGRRTPQSICLKGLGAKCAFRIDLATTGGPNGPNHMSTLILWVTCSQQSPEPLASSKYCPSCKSLPTMGLASGCCSVSNLFGRISHFVFLDPAVEKLRNWLLGITESGWRWWCYTLEGYNRHHNRQPFWLPASASCASGSLSTAFKYQGVRNILGEASAGMEARNPSTAGSKAEILSQMWCSDLHS